MRNRILCFILQRSVALPLPFFIIHFSFRFICMWILEQCDVMLILDLRQPINSAFIIYYQKNKNRITVLAVVIVTIMTLRSASSENLWDKVHYSLLPKPRERRKRWFPQKSFQLYYNIHTWWKITVSSWSKVKQTFVVRK